MTFEEFKIKLSNVVTAKGQRANYRNISVSSRSVLFTRDSTDNQETVLLKELYNLYSTEEFINTVVARDYITGRVYSPSVAILKAAGLISNDGYRLGFVKEESTLKIKHGDHIRHEPAIKKKEPIKLKKGKVKDEDLFFIALKDYLGPNRLYSKSIGSGIDSSDVYLSDDYTKYGFKSNKANNAISEIITALDGTDTFNNKSLSHHVDGLIHDHPVIGNRIVEFDEEQHFTPARRDSLLILNKSMNIPYLERFIEICNNLDYLNNNVLRKHRIKPKLESVPDTFIDFITWLGNDNVSDSGYIAAKPAFNFKGGRIAQRAYYDCLRDVAHLSEFNKTHKLRPPLRFAKYSFEKKYSKNFSDLTKEEITNVIKEILMQDYTILI